MTKIDMAVSSYIPPSWLHEHRWKAKKKQRLWFFSKPPLHRRVEMWLLYDGFFLLPSSGRILFNIQFNVSSKVLTLNADIISTIRKCNCVTISSGCFNQSDCFIRSRNPKYFCSTFRNLQSAINRQLLTCFSLYGSSPEQILCIWKILIISRIGSCIIINSFFFRTL